MSFRQLITSTRIIVTAVMACTLISAWFGRGSPEHHWLSYALLLYLGLPFFIAAILNPLWTAQEGWRALRSLAWVVFILISIVTSWQLGEFLHASDMAEARAFPNIALPIVQDYQKTHPELPENLAQIPNMPPIPALLICGKTNNFFTFTMRIDELFMDHFESYNEHEKRWDYAGD